MKKLLILGAAAAMLSVTSCGHGSQADGQGLDSLFSQAKQDSLFAVEAKVQGWEVAEYFNEMKESNPSLTKAEFLRGFQYALGADTTAAFSMGFSMGSNFNAYTDKMKGMDIKIDRQKYFANFRTAFMADSVKSIERMEADRDYNRLSRELDIAMNAYREAKINASEESQENIRAGRAYVDSLRKADPSVEVTASGVAIKVEKEGVGPKLTADDVAYIKISGQPVGGRTIDFNNGSTPVAVANALCPGLIEALTNFNPGTQATVVVPGSEAFGAYGIARGQRVGPNATMIFNIEVGDLYNTSKDPASKVH